MKNVVVGISGSIAAYKACDIVSSLTKKGYNVSVIMTRNATKFITPLTLQTLSKNHVFVDVFDELDPSRVTHIQLAKDADLVLLAPASANLIARLAYGLADDMLTSMMLAVVDTPILIAPAMNEKMYGNYIVQENLKKLCNNGYTLIEPRFARLACDDFGKGALALVEDIMKQVEVYLAV